MKIILHGILKDQFPSMDIVAETAADAIEGWSRQCGMADIPIDDRPLLSVLNFKSFELLNSPTDVIELHIYPTMFGGGAVGRIVIGAALIVGGIFVSAIPGMQLLGVAMISAGIGMAIGGVMQLFMKTPSVDKSNDPEASKYLGGGGNTTAIGTLIGKGYGRFLTGGQYMSIQVNSNDMVYGTFPTTVPA